MRRALIAAALAVVAAVWAWRKPLAHRPLWLDDFDRHGGTR